MKQLESALCQLGILYDKNMIDKYRDYMDGILKWNKMVNITAITEKKDFIEKHYIDSLLCVSYPQFKKAQYVIDVGTGGGFPGIPLAIVAPDKKFVLMDSLNKRIRIIKELCDEIGINNVEAIHGRAEEIAKNKIYRQNFDLCVSRAVANLSVLSEYCIPFLKKGGWFLAYKGPEVEKKIEESKKAVHILGGKIQKKEQVAVKNFDFDHKLIFIEKINDTPTKYPRKAGTPSKEPLK